MRKFLFVAALLALLVPASAFAAPDRVGKWDVGFDLAGAISTDSDLNSTVYVGANGSYGVNNWFAMGWSFGWQSFGEDSVLGISLPDVTSYPLFADFIFRLNNPNQKYVPYGVVGIGAIFWDVDDVTISGVTAQTDIDTSLGIKLGAGVDWFVNDNWMVNVDAHYVFTNADTDINLVGTGIRVSDTSDLDYWHIGAGVKYLF